MEHGALGARLTGAGFGGCIVALVAEANIEAVMEGVGRGSP
jgi:galactokinase